jgi:DNA (cytosine-5)-methyltransferase 1
MGSGRDTGDADMNFLSLFSGIGGFDLAFERAGMVSDSVVEIDKNAQNILKRHFPNSKLYSDVKEVGNAVAVPVVDWIGKRINNT